MHHSFFPFYFEFTVKSSNVAHVGGIVTLRNFFARIEAGGQWIRLAVYNGGGRWWWTMMKGLVGLIWIKKKSAFDFV
jgi:hypothetical protein